jgi:hypothetical protein
MIHPQPTHFLKNNKKEKRLCFFKTARICSTLLLSGQPSQTGEDRIFLIYSLCHCLQTRIPPRNCIIMVTHRQHTPTCVCQDCPVIPFWHLSLLQENRNGYHPLSTDCGFEVIKCCCVHFRTVLGRALLYHHSCCRSFSNDQW